MRNPGAPVELTRATIRPFQSTWEYGDSGIGAPIETSASAARGLRSSARELVARVLQSDIVGNDEFVEMLVELLAQLRLDVEQDAVRQDENIGVGEDASLRGEKESVAALAWAGAAGYGWWSWRAAGARGLRR
jgi:hypothetical protein